MLTCLLSYEAERRMIRMLETSAINTPDARRARRPLLTFTLSQGRLTGMPVLGMLYPSPALARLPTRGNSADWAASRRQGRNRGTGRGSHRRRTPAGNGGRADGWA